MEEIKQIKCSCIQCNVQFEPYKNTVVCHICNGDTFIEHDDDFMRSGFRDCWQCQGMGELTVIETSFCDDDCREFHFDDQVE